MAVPAQLQQKEGIAGERRNDRRYQIPLELRWKLIRRRKVLHSGDGLTLDLSSGGILFDARRPLPVGMDVELSIAWPVLLNDIAAMQLVVSGRIVRSGGNVAAIRMIQHEFRTAGAANDSPRETAASHAPALFLASRNARNPGVLH